MLLSMGHIILIVVIAYILYFLFVKGVAWTIVCSFFSWVGIYLLLKGISPSLAEPNITILNLNLSWAQVIPTFITYMAFVHNKD